MKIIPAIDIIDGCAVRLTQGDYSRMKRYSDSPVSVARDMADCGSKYLHVVDLDGARSGKADNASVIAEIVRLNALNVEIGGGIRSEESILRYLDAGASRVILGTVAVSDYDFTLDMRRKYGDKIAVGVDAREGIVAVHGWESDSGVDAYDFCRQLASDGICDVIFTDISKDGAMSGTNLDAYRTLASIDGLKVTASGGICSLAELKALQDIGVDGAILGKALYEGKLNLRAVEEAFCNAG
ncbi:MAG: 1-(5-phosphoribosyl)-5-[(5-phosphoribosylamino)methylideneamino]imidazole-4-carboxamide isomerase [Clostridia bacterium]|nr:1-(5-phosphoribosyl)-5-[(5-phosphoribosylamino)methylideneamino]imidazole-4-carboxamide isomerase [Clostridia bacterium]